MGSNKLWSQVFSEMSECPSAELLAEQLMKASDRPIEYSIQTHIELCGRCQAEMELMKGFMEADPDPDEIASVDWIVARLSRPPQPDAESKTVSSWIENWWHRISQIGRFPLMAAGAAAASVVLMFLALTDFSPPEISLNQSEPMVFRSESIHGLSPTGVLTSIPSEFQWEAVPQAESYECIFFELDMNQLALERTGSTSIEVPEVLSRHLLKGRPLLWQVTARGKDRQMIAQSNLVRLQVDEDPDESR